MPTVSTAIAPASRRRPRRPGGHTYGLLWGLLLTALLSLPQSLLSAEPADDSAGFAVKQASVSLDNGVYQVDAQLQYRLDGKPREALENGVPLVLEVALKVQRVRTYLWNETIAEVLMRHKLNYRGLTQQYQLENLSTGEKESFTSLAAALNYLRQLHAFPLIDESLLQPGDSYLLSIRTDLDIESLPTPLRALAYVTPDWYRSSAWFTVPLR